MAENFSLQGSSTTPTGTDPSEPIFTAIIMAENFSLRGSSTTPTGTDPSEQLNVRAQRRDLQLQVEASPRFLMIMGILMNNKQGLREGVQGVHPTRA